MSKSLELGSELFNATKVILFPTYCSRTVVESPEAPAACRHPSSWINDFIVDRGAEK
jgi:hypothetical protein